MVYSSNILMTNFQSDVEELTFQHFSIRKVTNQNWKEVKDRFPGYTVYSNGRYYIQQDYKKIPKDPRDQVGLGRIPYDSEDLMLLLRLFKPNDIGFEGQVIWTPENEMSRRGWLKSLYDVSDQDRVDKLKEDFKSIKTDSLKQKLLRALGSELPRS